MQHENIAHEDKAFLVQRWLSLVHENPLDFPVHCLCTREV